MAADIVLETLLDAREVPTPPAAALRVLEIKNDPEASINDLVEAVQQDPSLAAKILSTANSPVYRRGDEVTSVDRAVSLIGFRSVTTIALAFSVASTMPGSGSVAGIPMSTFWTRSLLTASAARLASRSLAPQLSEEAFFVGLVAGLGRVVMGMVIPDHYEPLATEHEGWPSLASEHATFDFSSAVTTAGLLRKWGMPEMFAAAADQIETVPSAGGDGSDESEIARIVRLSMAVTTFYVEEGDGWVLRELIAHALEYGLAPEAVDELLDATRDNVQELAEQFELAINGASYESLVANARAQLVELSLQTDAELRAESDRRAALEVEKAQLEAEARNDPLTGLFNRRAFDEQFDQNLSLRIRDPRVFTKPMGVIMIDLDHFKSVNDTHGHDGGDAVLVKLADVLRLTTRTEEIVARFGGEEFILLAPSATEEELLRAAERIRAGIELMEVELPGGGYLKVTASLGAAVLETATTADDGTMLVKAADQALYAAKANGRNQVQLGHIGA